MAAGGADLRVQRLPRRRIRFAHVCRQPRQCVRHPWLLVHHHLPLPHKPLGKGGARGEVGVWAGSARLRKDRHDLVTLLPHHRVHARHLHDEHVDAPRRAASVRLHSHRPPLHRSPRILP